MARIAQTNKRPPAEINRFLGINEDTTGDTQLQLGESPYMVNYRVTENYKLKTREGYEQLFDSIGEYEVDGMWYGKVNNSYYFLFASNGVMYVRDSLAGADYDSIDNATYTNVSAVKTSAYALAVAGTTVADGYTIVNDKLGNTLTEIAAADIDDLDSIGTYYYHTDKTIWFVVAKDAYADIAAARTGLGTCTAYYRIGTCANAPVRFISVEDVVYTFDGTAVKRFNGTTYAPPTGYVPVITVATPPAGGGTLYEQVNLITGSKKQWFSGDGATTTYQLAELAIDSVDSIVVGVTTLTEGTHFTVNKTNGTIDFTAGTSPHGAPADDTNNVIIQYTKANANNIAMINTCKYGMLFGGGNDTKLHLWGNSTYPNRRFTSGTPVDSSTTALYFPVNSNADIGSYEYAITDIIRQYDRQIILTEKDAYYSYYELTDDGASFPVYPLNGVIGNVAHGQAQLVQNNPFSVFNGVYEWVATSVRDERNAQYISKKVQPSMDEVDLSEAITVDWEEKGEYWLCVGATVWVFNYRNGTWYKFTLTDTPTCFRVIDGELYFGTDNGEIMKFDSTLRSDNGVAFTRQWEMHFYDFDAEWLRKYANRIWLSIKPDTKTRVKLKYQTDRSGYSDEYEAYYNLLDFEHIDFDHFSFLTNYNPQPFRFKVKAKKFTYFKVILYNDSATEIETILSLNILGRYGGEVK